MYEAHNLGWLLAAFFIAAVLFAAFTIRRVAGRPSGGAKPAASKGPILAWTLALLALLAVFALKGHDVRRMRAALQAVPPSAISQVQLSKDGLQRTLTSPAEISQLLSQLTSLRSISPHHSSPTDQVEITFESQGRHYHYRVGRDSERPQEFWIIAMGDQPPSSPGVEIGRVESAQLGPLLQRLLEAK